MKFVQKIKDFFKMFLKDKIQEKSQDKSNYKYKKGNPILIIRSDGYSYEQFDPMLHDINQYFDEILELLKVKNKHGKDVKIKLSLEATNPDTIKAFAIRTNKELGEYEIRMSAGLSYHIWLTSRFVMADYEYFTWANNCHVIDEELKSKNIKEILADSTYHLLTYYILLHELSHILLGHCDFIQDRMGINSLDEFKDERELLKEEVLIRKAFEADADRQAGEYLIAIFNASLGDDGLGVKFKFPNREAVFEFYTYSVTSIFTLLQQFSLRQETIHPLPNERQSIVITAMRRYLEKYNIKDSEAIVLLSMIYMMDAAQKFGLIGSMDSLDIVNNIENIGWVAEILNQTKIKEYQHKIIT